MDKYTLLDETINQVMDAETRYKNYKNQVSNEK